jgi:hypothetical protein
MRRSIRDEFSKKTVAKHLFDTRGKRIPERETGRE